MPKQGKLRVIHEQIDQEVKPLENIHKARLKCAAGCHDCCVDDLTVFEVEAERIRNAYGELLESSLPHPIGKCAFLDENAHCRIYDARPYVCRTQGLPLRWTEDEFEYRDICPLNEEGTPIETLSEDQCWTLGPYEGQLALLQSNGRRVDLRSLFKAADRES